MPETQPGYHLMEERDKRSATETVLPSPLPASPFPPSVSGTRSTTGSRAWPSVCTGTWGRNRTTLAPRTRSSEATRSSLRSPGLWRHEFSLSMLCFMFLWREGITKLFSKNICCTNVALHMDWNDSTEYVCYWSKKRFCCSLLCCILVEEMWGSKRQALKAQSCKIKHNILVVFCSVLAASSRWVCWRRDRLKGVVAENANCYCQQTWEMT